MAEPLIKIYPYQRRWLDDRSKFKIGMVTRQGGKTKYMAALEVVEDCLAAESVGGHARWIWLSRGERQAKEAMIEAIAPLFRLYAEAARYKKLVGEVSVRDLEWSLDGVTKYAGAEITLPRGSRITALPANPDTARGFTANTVLDEFALHRDSRAIWRGIFASISRRDLVLRVISTPNGRNNKFYELMTSKDLRCVACGHFFVPGETAPGLLGRLKDAVLGAPTPKCPRCGSEGKPVWSRHITDIYQAVADGLDRDVEELRHGCGDEELWQQEYELKWLDEATAWIPMDLITAVENPLAGDPVKYAQGPCFVGNDIAARGDLWVAWVWEVVGDVLWTREIKVLRRASFAEHDAEIARIMTDYRVAMLLMDQTGMGEKPVEDARRRYPGRVQGIQFTAPTKLALATVGKGAFEDRKVRIPEGDLELRADLHKLKKVVGDAGVPRFVAERDGAGHADRTWAAFLGIFGAFGGGNKFPDPDIFFYSGDDDGPEEDAYAALQRKGPERFIRNRW